MHTVNCVNRYNSIVLIDTTVINRNNNNIYRDKND